MDRDRGISSFLSTLIFGVGLGFIIGILTAEKTGEELRKDLKFNSNEILDNLKDKYELIREKATDKLSEFQDLADEKFHFSAISIQDQINSIATQLDHLSKRADDTSNLEETK